MQVFCSAVRTKQWKKERQRDSLGSILPCRECVYFLQEKEPGTLCFTEKQRKNLQGNRESFPIADFTPTEGIFLNSSINFSSETIAITPNPQSLKSETGNVHSAGNFAHFSLQCFVCLAHCFVDGRNKQIFKHFNILGVNNIGLNFN